MSKTVLLDPGHGGHDSGALQLSTGRKESNDVLRLGLRVRHFLSKSDVDVKITRETDVFVVLEDRPRYSNQIDADLLVSLHRNSAAGNTQANGVEVWVHPLAPPIDTAYAQNMLEYLAAVGIQSNRGVKEGSYVVLNCKAPAMLVELGFMNNSKDNLLFDQKLDAYAKAIAQSICYSIGIVWLDPGTSQPSPEPQKLWRVQVGAFSNKNNAEKLLADLKSKRYDVYMVGPSDERAEPK